MPTIVLRKFDGELPRVQPYLLPEDAAQLAVNCDLTRGSLDPMAGGLLFSTMSSNPIRSIYTKDGINFFTWTTDVDAFASPVVNDAYDRVYYISSGTLRVTTHGVASPTGGSPSQSWKAGVPAPTAAPALAVTTRTTLVDYPSATLSWRGWFDAGGVRYDEASVTMATVTALQEYTFTMPAKGVNTPASAAFVLELSIKDGNKVVLTLASKDGAVASRSSALPGGVELSLRSNTSNYSALLTWGAVETRAYTYTCVNTWLEESVPAPAALVSPTYIQNVTVTMSQPTFTDYRPFTGYNVYRTFGTNAAYLKVNSSPTSSNPYTDTSMSPTSAFSALPSENWVEPPTSLSGMVAMPNGYFAAFKNNALHFSEPYRPGAWPYSISFPKNIRGICAGGQSLVVTTAEACYSVFGAHPASVQSQTLPLPQGGISKRSMTNVEGAVVFASPDGLVLVSGSDATLDFSQRLFTRKDWQDRYGSSLADASLRLAYHDGYLIGTSYARSVGFAVRPNSEGLAYTRYDVQMDTMFNLPVLDTLYYAASNTVYRFRAGSPLTLDWRSREFVFPKYINFAIGYIRATANVTVTIYREGEQFYQFVTTTTVDNNMTNGVDATAQTFRLPAGLTGLRWSVRLQTTGTVHELILASSVEELRNV